MTQSLINEIMSFSEKMDGIGDQHIECDKLKTKSQILHVLTHLWNLDLK
jgi:hypothetical protein